MTPAKLLRKERENALIISPQLWGFSPHRRDAYCGPQSGIIVGLYPTPPQLFESSVYGLLIYYMTWYCLIQPDTAWYWLIQPDDTAWYCLILPDTAWYWLILTDTDWYCLILPAPYLRKELNPSCRGKTELRVWPNSAQLVQQYYVITFCPIPFYYSFLLDNHYFSISWVIFLLNWFSTMIYTSVFWYWHEFRVRLVSQGRVWQQNVEWWRNCEIF